MNDKELEQLQHDLENQLTEQQKADAMIINAAEEIAAALLLHDGTPCHYKINDVEYLFRYCIDEKSKEIIVVVINTQRYMLSDGKLGFTTAKSPLDEEYTLKEGLVATVEGYIRHITGNIKPEMLDDE